MGIIYSAGMYCNSFDLVLNLRQPEGTKRFFAYCSEKLWSPWASFKGYKVYNGRIHVYSDKPKDAGGLACISIILEVKTQTLGVM